MRSPASRVIAASPRNRLSPARTTIGADTTQARTVGWMSIEVTWRGPFENGELNTLHAAAFHTRCTATRSGTGVSSSSGTASVGSWRAMTLGLAGFANVVWDGLVHAWIQDVMVDDRVGRQGVGTAIVAACAEGARAAGCEILHVDFEDDLAAFYIDACGFTPARAGLLSLAADDHDDRGVPVSRAGCGNRTHDLMITSQVLCQLS